MKSSFQSTSGLLCRSKILPVSQRGLTLVELMVALVLGLVLTGAVINVFLSAKQTFVVNDNLGKIQDNARTSFELLSRNLREVGRTSCGTNSIQTGNVIRIGGAIPWWANWNGGVIRGFDGSESSTNTDEIAAAASIVATGTSVGQRVAGTDAVLVLSSAPDEQTIVAHDTATNQFTLSDMGGIEGSDVLIVCDLGGSVILQAGAVNTGNKKIDYDPAISNNCTDKLGPATPINCTTPAPTVKTFSVQGDGKVAKLSTNFWYVGNNARGGRSLYNIRMVSKGTPSAKQWTPDTQEFIPGVQDMQLTYLTKASSKTLPETDWVSANNDTNFQFPPIGSTQVRDWSANNDYQVIGVRLELTYQSDENISVTNTPVQRKMFAVVGLRSRAIVQ